jgi:hypothetical protein
MSRKGRKGMGGHELPNRGETNDWLTPPSIIETLGPFDLDPCTPWSMPWRTASLMLTEFDDGLWFPWRGRVWLNPPYGPDTGDWLERLAAHGHGTALIFARTETAAWHKHVWPKATAITFLDGRLHFHRPSGERAKLNAGAPSALVAYGHEDADRLRQAGSLGATVNL